MSKVRLLARSDVERLLDMAACIDAVENAFRMRGTGRPIPSDILGLRASKGGFHIKAALLPGDAKDSGFFVTKINANFPENPALRGLPTIQGLLVLFDTTAGTPLAVMDSAALTILRTAAATAVAARHLAKADARCVAIVGCGAQALAQLRAVSVVRSIDRVIAFDSASGSADRFASMATEALGIPATSSKTLQGATLAADIVITCTTSSRAFLSADHVRPGTFIGAVGADSEHKQEIEPALLKSSAVFTDATSQCVKIGDLHHAIEAGLMKASDVRAELGDVVADPSRGRQNEQEVVIFDSTGVAFQDVVAAALVYAAAVEQDAGTTVDFTA